MISCIIPVHNRSRLLGRAIASVVVQNVSDTELIVVDDASTENLQACAREFDGVPNLTVRYFRLPKGGANAARAYGQDRATEPFVQFLDSDDVLLPGKWAAQLKHLRAEADLAASVAGTYRREGSRYHCLDPGYPARRITALSFIRDQTMFKTGAPLWVRDALLRVVEWPSSLSSSQDWESHLRALLCGLRFRYCPTSGYLQLPARSCRIADRPVTSKAANKIWAMYHALSAAKRHGKKGSLRIRLSMLVLATHRLGVYWKHGRLSGSATILPPYVRLLRECLS